MTVKQSMGRVVGRPEALVLSLDVADSHVFLRQWSNKCQLTFREEALAK